MFASNVTDTCFQIKLATQKHSFVHASQRRKTENQ